MTLPALLGRLSPARSAAVPVLAVAAVYAVTLGGLERRGFWIIDNANKYLQMQAILASGYHSTALPWPGREIDPDFEFNPLPPPFSRVEGGELYSFYPPFFAVASSLPFRAFGTWGLYLLPWLGALLTLAGVARLAGDTGLAPPGRGAAVLLAGLCTPLWFYSVVFWEHTPALGLAVWGVALLLRSIESGARRDLVGGSLLATLAIYFRDELYLLCGVLVALATLLAPGRRVAVAVTALSTMAVAILPLWIFQWQALGHPLGFHVVSQTAGGVLAHLLDRPAVAYVLFLAFVPSVPLSLALSAPFVLAFLWNPRLRPAVFRVVLPAAAGVAVLCATPSLLGYLRAGNALEWMNRSNGLFSAAPILLLGLVRLHRAPGPGSRAGSPGERTAQRLWLVALGYSALYVLASPRTGSAGIHWGNRLLLLLYPLLVVLAARNLALWRDAARSRRRLGALLLAACVLVSAGAQVTSIHLLATRKRYSQRLSAAILARPEPVIVTDLWWVPQDLFAVFLDRPVFYVASDDQADRLLDRLRRRGHDRLLFVTRPERQPVGDIVARVDDPLGFFGLEFVRVEIR